MAVHIQEIGTARSAGKSGGGSMGLSSRREIDFGAALAEHSRRTSPPATPAPNDSIRKHASSSSHDPEAQDSTHHDEEAGTSPSQTDPSSASTHKREARRAGKKDKSTRAAQDEVTSGDSAEEPSSPDQASSTAKTSEADAASSDQAADAKNSEKAKKEEPDLVGKSDSSEDAAREAMLAAAAATTAKANPAKAPSPPAEPGDASKSAKASLKGRAAAAGANAAGQSIPATAGTPGEGNGDGSPDVAALEALADAEGSPATDESQEAKPASKKDAPTAAPPGIGQSNGAGLGNVPVLGAPAAGVAAAAQSGAKTTNPSGQPAGSDGQRSSQAVDAMDATLAALEPDQPSAHKAAPGDDNASDISASAFRDALAHVPADKTTAPAPAPAPAAPMPRPEVRFTDVNHPSIVQGITGQLLPQGGTMHLRLDPPELGAMQVTVNVKDGLMTASFQTSNDEATRLLSHSLHDLKSLLESQGVQVQKLQVQQQSSQNFDSKGDGGDGSRQQQQAMQDQSARQEQQRKEMIRRMWAKLGVGNDPLDITG
jgi:flagellar hook-length control protein FliK